MAAGRRSTSPTARRVSRAPPSPATPPGTSARGPPAPRARRGSGASPEMLLRVAGRTATTFPIAGTRPLGPSPSESERLARDLLGDAKERAEHNMLVDLARNDIGKVCGFGSVQVPQYMAVERYSH